MRGHARDHAHTDRMRLITLFEYRRFIYICLPEAGRHLLGFIDRIISRPPYFFLCVPAFSVRCNKRDMIEVM